MNKSTPLSFAFSILAASFTPSLASPQITRLGSLPGGGNSIAFDLNEQGQVVGQAFNSSGVLHAFLWENGVMTDLDPANPGVGSNAWAINNLGIAVGYTVGADTFYQAMRWDHGTRTNLDELLRVPGPSQLFDINDDGTMVGGFSIVDGWTRPTVIDPTMTVVSQPLSGGNEAGYMRGINQAGVIVGHDFIFGVPDDAMCVLPDPEGGYQTPVKLPEQLGKEPYPFTLAYDINDSGTIVGASNNGSGTSEAAMWTPDRDGVYALNLLGTVGDHDTALAWCVNADGVIVGQSRFEDVLLGDPAAFMVLDGRMIDLNTFLEKGGEFTVLLGAHGINDAGDICGFGRTVDGTLEGFVLTGVIPCGADMNGDGLLDNGDIGAFIGLYLAGDLAADFNSDGLLDNGDIGAFIGAFLAGC